MTTSRRDFLQTLLALGGATAALSAAGCGDDDGPAGADSGTPRPDGGTPRVDSGTPRDSGTPDEDAGTPDEDAGTPDEDAGTDAGPEPEVCDAVDVTIGTNHGHRLVVPTADVVAATERTYDIRGTSGHPHTIIVSPANFMTLAAGGTVMVTSSRDGGGGGHTHSVTLVCG